MTSEVEINTAIAAIMVREGGYSDDPTDRGGATQFGITQATAAEFGYTGDMRELSIDEARAIYRAIFKRSRIDLIPDAATFDLVSDCVVNHGERRAVKWLQQALNVTPADGLIGSHTIMVLNAVASGQGAMTWRKVRDSITATRVRFYGDIVVNDPTQVRFLGGWLARATRLLG